MNNPQNCGLDSLNLPSEVNHCPILDPRNHIKIFYEPIKRKRRIGAERVLGDYKDIIEEPPRPVPGEFLSAGTPTNLQSSWLEELKSLGGENISGLETIVAEMTKEIRNIGRETFAQREEIFNLIKQVEGPETKEDAACRAAAVQAAYRMDKELVVRNIINPEGNWEHQATNGAVLESICVSKGNSCSIPPSVVPDLRSHNTPDEELLLLHPFTPAEVCQRLNMEQFAVAGMDDLKASSWSKVDPGGIVLSEIFSRCLRLGRVPFSWKKRRTILVRNRGDCSSVVSWRPLSILPTVAKIYAGCIADRISTWAGMGKRVSYPFQKGLNSSKERLAEHAFLMQAIIEDAWRNQKEVALAWLKTEETFCSIDIEKISRTLHLLGLPEKMLRIVEDFYSVDHTFVSYGCDQLGYKRVDQGCPLYPILFILSTEPIIRAAMAKRAVTAYHLGTQSICILAHSGEMVLVARSSGMLRSLLWSVEKAADWIGINFKANKCASFHMRRMKVVTSTFKIQGNNILSLNQGTSYSFFGVPIGLRVNQISATAKNSFLKELHAVDASYLAPWQKLDALRAFLIPPFESYTKAYKVKKKYNINIDKKICEIIRSWMFLPQRSSKEVIYLPPSLGGAGFLPFRLSSDLHFIELGFHLLTSEDPTVQRSALESLQDVVHRKIGRGKKIPNESILCKYLNGDSKGRLGADVGDASSIWSRIRKATRHAKSTVRIKWGWNKTMKKIFMKISAVGPNVKMEKVAYSSRRCVDKILRRAAEESFLKRLIAKPDQGKVYELSSISSVSNHLLQSGCYTRFCDWRFIHRARLNVLPLNAALRGGICKETKCRRCGTAEETLPHVLNHCPAHMKAIVKRHDKILNLLASSLPSGWKIEINKTVPGTNSSLRPDVLAKESCEGPFHMVDLAVAFENRSLAFINARKSKIRKYSSLAKSLRDSLGNKFQVTLAALVVGSLGSWDQGNDKVLERFCISGKRARNIREKMVSIAIRWSRNIYVEHVTGKCQYDGIT